MWFPVTTIRLAVKSPEQSVVFYEALLGVRASPSPAQDISFDVEALRLALTLLQRTDVRPEEPERGPPTAKPRSRFTLYVSDPHRIGDVAIALRRARVALRLGDRGLSTHDPDGNEWSVVLGPSTRNPVEQEGAKADRGP